MKAYLNIVNNILENGIRKNDRTGVGTIGVTGERFQHDMSEGFPLLTTKKMAYKSIKVELEGFIKGITDKKWYQERGCNIWNEWCNPKKVLYGHDAETQKKMSEELDLGTVYGFQWRHWNAAYNDEKTDYSGKGIDQLEQMVQKLKKNPADRRNLVSAWNPEQINQMALPPCHLLYQVLVQDDKLDLIWYQRSVDTMLGLPFNIASYATLLHLLAKETGLKEGTLTGFLGDTHIYVNHLEQAKEQTKREPLQLPKIVTESFTTIFEWNHENTKIIDYQNQGPIKFPIAV
ncbi:thymidylate synthase [Candidatus Woesearchaeota archaeon]|nr:thymidylate synthase [Candidatus Woesearchaeota archaeon]